jgi:uncharacterized protein
MIDALAAASGDPMLIGALHLPDLSVRRHLGMAFLEDYTLANMEAFVGGGMRRVILQDQTRRTGRASAETIALVSALARTAKRAFPALVLGIIVQAHDAEAPIAIANASGADFVRLKVFVGAAMTFEGHREALAVEAVTYRHGLRRDDIAILADVYDRTCYPTIAATPEQAARSAVHHGADALVLTGSSMADSLARITAAREAGIRRPLVLGGGLTEETVAEALGVADGAIVSTSLMIDGTTADSVLRWDKDRVRRLVEKAGSMSA